MPTFPDHPEPDRPCPNCGGRGMRVFYDVDRVPVQSNLLMPAQAEALACPTRRLRLAHCPACGFITNTAFAFDTQQLTANYEASQGCSPTFNAFAKSLAKRWAQTYQLAGKDALEIGCGKGEFITLLCEAAGCRGVGIDPTLNPARLPNDLGGRVRFIADFYSDKYAGLPADFVCCRHTLEHIPETAAFLGMIRRAIGGRPKVIVGFETPDTLRILREGAFWDLYYEHCSYFTAGSLARLFRAQGFDLLDLRREFDGQYLVLDARPVAGATKATLPEEEDLRITADAVSTFASACAARITRWRGVIDDARAAGRRVVLWGSGSKAVGFLTTLGASFDEVPYVVDINPHKHDTHLPGTGQRIVAPQTLAAYRPDVVIAMNPVYRAEIARDLEGLGVRAELLTL